ncbi:bifunctional (p)ppGpp synthetase/guanosine-3',5'-bis(diphosphate) 3'-pyrophosphohydrolase [bacterium]|nr:MAG: bifunctional (p)ppGpp synthetase/guanosine-3',5'-bis(diphosphate) 3'-pyrophosphohydrolase [bacterium]
MNYEPPTMNARTAYSLAMRYAKLDAALRFMVDAHAGQERDGDDPLPYAFHPFEVATNLRVVGGVTDEDLLCAAILHDVLEETEASAEGIETHFGERVRELVEELTREEPDAATREKLDKDALWQLRADLLIEEIGKMSPEAQSVKLADRLSNVRDAKRTKPPKKRDRYVAQTVRILDTVPRKVNPKLWDAIKKEV